MRRWLLLVVAALGCHRFGTTPAAAPPGERVSCVETAPYAKVLMVHWTEAQQDELHEAMKRGLAVVSARCDGIKLLPACSIAGLYQYFGITPTAQNFDLEPGELSANLSFGQPGTISAPQGVRIETIRVGRLATARRRTEKAELVGACEGATHFVRTVSVGLFGLGERGGTSGWVRADEERPNPAACARGTPVDAAPPPGCRQLLRAELTGIGARELDGRDATITFCPSGWAFGEGKCVARKGASVYECADGVPECTAQCERGSAASCNRLGFLHANGLAGLSKDEVQGALLYKRACEGGVAVGCSNLGVLLAEKGAPERQLAQAADLFLRGCESGYPASCTNLGISYMQGEGVATDRSRALLFFAHACRGGDRIGCFNAGTILERQGLPDSLGKALVMFTLACDGGEPAGCFGAGELLGTDETNLSQRRRLLERACRGGYAKGCRALERP